MEKKKRFIKVVSIVLIAAFMNLTIYQEQKEAEAVVPIVAILVDAAICSAISAGVTYAVPKIEQHIAAQQVANLTEAEIAAIELEGGVTKLTSAEIKAAERWGLKPKPGVKSCFRIKGAGKAALISGALSLGIAGASYGIDYLSRDKMDTVEGIEETQEKGTVITEGYSDGNGRVYIGGYDGTDELIGSSLIRDRYFELHVPDGAVGYIGVREYSLGSNYRSITRKADGTCSFDSIAGPTSWIALRYGDYDFTGYTGITENGSKSFYADTRGAYTRYYITIYIDGEGAYQFIEDEDQYRYTGTVAAEDISIINNNYYNDNRDILEQTLEKQDEIIYLLQNQDGSVDIQRTTELPDGTEVVEPGAADADSHGGILGWFREVWLKLCEIANSILEIPLHLFEAIQTLLTDLFVPTIAFTDILTDIKTVAMTKAPFSWFDAFVGSANVTYGDVPLVISWTAGVHTNQDVSVTVPKQEKVRNFSTVIITFVALFAAYHEIRRWVG